MESKEQKKTAAQIEAEVPFIKPEDCPRELMKWVVNRDDAQHELWLGMLRKELMPIKRFMRIASSNRIWLIGLTAVVIAVVIVLWVHLVQ